MIERSGESITNQSAAMGKLPILTAWIKERLQLRTGYHYTILFPTRKLSTEVFWASHVTERLVH